MPTSTRTPLWQFVLPSRRERPLGLYVRRDAARDPAPDGTITLAPGEIAEFDTYFNAFSISKWLRHTTVRDVAVELTTRGHLRLEVVHGRLDRPPAVVACLEVESEAPARCELVVPPLAELGGGAIFVRATGTGTGTGGTILDAVWSTADPPQRETTIGVVITTFNRPDDVRANVANLVGALAESPLAGRVEVVVVDNGRNLDLGPDAAHVTLLPNANTGGAGGFARGLAYLPRAGRHARSLHGRRRDLRPGDRVPHRPAARLRDRSVAVHRGCDVRPRPAERAVRGRRAVPRHVAQPQSRDRPGPRRRGLARPARRRSRGRADRLRRVVVLRVPDRHHHRQPTAHVRARRRRVLGAHAHTRAHGGAQRHRSLARQLRAQERTARVVLRDAQLRARLRAHRTRLPLVAPAAALPEPLRPQPREPQVRERGEHHVRHAGVPARPRALARPRSGGAQRARAARTRTSA